jgi:3-isopropylmalate/(R)-2-methylmalate dehydratase large subunit
MQPKPKKMRINVNGTLSKGGTKRCCALYHCSIDNSGGTGYFAEYAGNVFEEMSHGRSNDFVTSIEMGAVVV